MLWRSISIDFATTTGIGAEPLRLPDARKEMNK
jgi:hypothetical protein